jgi:hypothetical protein
VNRYPVTGLDPRIGPTYGSVVKVAVPSVHETSPRNSVHETLTKLLSTKLWSNTRITPHKEVKRLTLKNSPEWNKDPYGENSGAKE